jgi:Diacylglycerol acyltransferase
VLVLQLLSLYCDLCSLLPARFFQSFTALLLLYKNPLILSLFCSEASKDSIKRALMQGTRVGIVPGGISEMFEGYPKADRHIDEEIVVIKSGLFQLAADQSASIRPVYCFGASQILKRIEIPWLEPLSRWLRTSLCVFYGQWGLTIPFRQRLVYVMGDAIQAASRDEMQRAFCKELKRIFDRHKHAYGWGDKTLRIIEH